MRSYKLLLFINLMLNSMSRSFNLVGNVYRASVKVPLLRIPQDMKLTFCTMNKAELELSGFINTKGYIDYEMHNFADNIKFIPDENIKKVIKKYRLTLDNVSYNSLDDTAKLHIKSNLVFLKQEVIFKRSYCLN